MAGCPCSDRWRVYLAPMYNPGGYSTQIVDFVSLTFEKVFLEPGRGSLTLVNRGDSAGEGLSNVGLASEQLRPHQTMVFIERLLGGAATPTTPVVMFGGFVESVQFAFDGTVTLGFVEAQKYLDYRNLGVASDKTSDWVYAGVNQTVIAADLVNYVRGLNTVGSEAFFTGQAMRIFGESNANAPVARDRTYLLAEYPNLGQMVTQLLQVIDGPVYEMRHERSTVTGLWSSYMRFSDVLAPAGVATILADDVTTMTISADSNEHANCIQGIGQSDSEEGSGGGETFEAAFASLPGSRWAPFDAVQTWDDVTEVATLQDHVEGYWQTHSDLTGSADVVLTGLDYPFLEYLQPGYPITLDVASPFLRFLTVDGNTTIDRVAWSVGEAEQITLGISALDLSNSIDPRTSETVCEDC